ncbi:cerebellin 11 [Astyanax mexicanus]|uniref:Complement C1q like 2 n=1 Tax=Astyanax mexicanus TaxID=7994 RepID=A0A8B9R2L5_ASTMX|nr:cerebellin 11 [Astyanax mexicanus]KAG9260116.1 complement C1q-like protein 4 isoform X1 [Astyanax mexicanus]
MRAVVVVLKVVLVVVLCGCGGEEVDVMKPTVNILSEVLKLQAVVEGLTAELNTVRNQLTEHKSLVHHLQQQITGSPKVAFTASMISTENSHRGPFPSETRLIFDKVLTNIGDAYDPTTGVFTAPVKGVYYFRYSGNAFAGSDMGLSIFKSGSRFVSSYEYASGSGSGFGERNDNASNGAVMQLEAGEQVHMQLWIRCWIFVDYRYNYSTFTGYLLYPL